MTFVLPTWSDKRCKGEGVMCVCLWREGGVGPSGLGGAAPALPVCDVPLAVPRNHCPQQAVEEGQEVCPPGAPATDGRERDGVSRSGPKLHRLAACPSSAQLWLIWGSNPALGTVEEVSALSPLTRDMENSPDAPSLTTDEMFARCLEIGSLGWLHS